MELELARGNNRKRNREADEWDYFYQNSIETLIREELSKRSRTLNYQDENLINTPSDSNFSINYSSCNFSPLASRNDISFSSEDRKDRAKLNKLQSPLLLQAIASTKSILIENLAISQKKLRELQLSDNSRLSIEQFIQKTLYDLEKLESFNKTL